MNVLPAAQAPQAADEAAQTGSDVSDNASDHSSEPDEPQDSADAEADAGADAGAGAGAGADADAGAGTDVDADADAESGSEAEANAGSDTEAGADSGSDANIEVVLDSDDEGTDAEDAAWRAGSSGTSGSPAEAAAAAAAPGAQAGSKGSPERRAAQQFPPQQRKPKRAAEAQLPGGAKRVQQALKLPEDYEEFAVGPALCARCAQQTALCPASRPGTLSCSAWQHPAKCVKMPLPGLFPCTLASSALCLWLRPLCSMCVACSIACSKATGLFEAGKRPAGGT